VKAALVRFFRHAQTPADISAVADYMDLARPLSLMYEFHSSASPARVSLSQPALGSTALLAPSSATAQPQATGSELCRYFDGWVDAKDFTGQFWLFQWHHKLDVCYNGSVVTTLNIDIHYVEHRDWSWQDRGVVDNSSQAAGAWQLQSYMSGHMEQCVLKYGCINDAYPSVGITAYGDGTASFWNMSEG